MTDKLKDTWNKIDTLVGYLEAVRDKRYPVGIAYTEIPAVIAEAREWLATDPIETLVLDAIAGERERIMSEIKKIAHKEHTPNPQVNAGVAKLVKKISIFLAPKVEPTHQNLT